MPVFEVIQTGMQTTVQDAGRWGFQQYGVPVAGAMDWYALRLANRLVGNADNTAALEVTLMGPRLAILRDVCMAITGANLVPQVNGVDVPMWQTLLLKKGDELHFAGLVDGCRAYIAVAGGIAVPAVMGSRSTYTRGQLGGFEGRQLKIGDRLAAGEASTEFLVGAQVPAELVPAYPTDIAVRVVLGPQDDQFTAEGIGTFFRACYTVTAEADRMGYRLEGEKIQHKDKADIISDGISLGSIQVPGHGMPIVMLADRQTTGGYTKIATVISTDIGKLAQAKPGDVIRFQKVSLTDAHAILRECEHQLAQWDPLAAAATSREDVRSYRITVDGTEYDVQIQEV